MGIANYAVELLFDHAPRIDADVVREAIAELWPAVTVQQSAATTIILRHDDLAVDGRPLQQAVLITDEAPSADLLAPALKQTWDWPEAEGALSRCRFQIMVTDVGAQEFDKLERLRRFQALIQALGRATRPLVVHWRPAGKLIAPAALEQAVANTDVSAAVLAATNVRMHHIENHGRRETVMDTLGLNALGLPDLQLHFRDLDAAAAARRLYSAAWYVFEQGDVLQDGHSIDGTEPEQRWIVHREESMLPPKRAVIDFDPGAPFNIER